MIIRYFIISAFLLIISALEVKSSSSALDMDKGKLLRTARLARSLQQMGELSKEADGLTEVRNIRMESRNVVSLAKDAKTVYVILHRPAINSLTLKQSNFRSAPFPGQFDYKLASVAISLTQPILTHLRDIFDKEDEIIIGGNQEAGGIASFLGYDIHRSLQSNDALSQNQLKIVTFCAPAVGNSEFVSSIHSQIGQANILNFYYFLSPSQSFYEWMKGYKACGVPFRLLPSEQFADACRSSERAVAMGLNLVLYSAIVYFAARYFYPCEPFPHLSNSLRSALTNTDEGIANQGILALISRTLEDERLKTIGISRRFTTRIFLASSLGALVNNFVQSKNSLLPTDTVLRDSFKYAQDTIRASTDGDYSLDQVGVPPILSSTRGVGGYFYSVFMT